MRCILAEPLPRKPNAMDVAHASKAISQGALGFVPTKIQSDFLQKATVYQCQKSAESS